MSRNKDVFLSLIPSNDNEIGFGGGYNAQIVRKGVVKIFGLPHLEDVYYVAKLTTSATLLLFLKALCVVIKMEITCSLSLD